MKKMRCTFLLFLVVFIAGCKIDDPGNVLSGNVYDTYQPVSKGSVWKYSRNGYKDVSTETQTMTGGKTVFDKKIYYTVRTQTGAYEDTLSHYSHDGNDYYQRIESVGAATAVEYLYLKEDYIIGRTWTANVSASGSIGSYLARIQGSIIEKNTTVNVSDRKFTNVIHTRLNFQYDKGAGFETIEVMDYYIAKGVGIIKINYTSDTAAPSNRSLTDFEIK